ncbi:hypothetical protein Csa_020825, partial [Cucumis sativus]
SFCNLGNSSNFTYLKKIVVKKISSHIKEIGSFAVKAPSIPRKVIQLSHGLYPPPKLGYWKINTDVLVQP